MPSRGKSCHTGQGCLDGTTIGNRIRQGESTQCPLCGLTVHNNNKCIYAHLAVLSVPKKGCKGRSQCSVVRNEFVSRPGAWTGEQVYAEMVENASVGGQAPVAASEWCELLALALMTKASSSWAFKYACSN